MVTARKLCPLRFWVATHQHIKVIVSFFLSTSLKILLHLRVCKDLFSNTMIYFL